LKLGRILREIFGSTGTEYERKLSQIRETEQRLDRCLTILDSRTGHSIQEASEEAAGFDGD
jgi:hypothetical protein